MLRKNSLILVLLMLASASILQGFSVFVKADPAIIYVPDNFATIQEAIDASNDGDTIIVRNGTYSEDLNVYMAVTLRSEKGWSNCIIVGKIEISADHVTISGFTVLLSPSNGIVVYSSNNLIENNNVTLSKYNGIIPWEGSCNNTITHNFVLNNGWKYQVANGIQLHAGGGGGANNNTVTYNTVINNTGNGILLWGISGVGASYNLVSNNFVMSNWQNGIQIGNEACHNNTVMDNYIVSNGFLGKGNGQGILLLGSSSSLVTNNTIMNNFISDTANNGIQLQLATNNIVSKNTALITGDNGILVLQDSKDNQIYLNNFKDLSCDTTTNNTWNSPTQLTYYYAGQEYKNYLGNYWADYAGVDADENGIGDTPYIRNKESDNYPLMAKAEGLLIKPLFVPDDHKTIQAAVNAATAKGTIYVRNGTYEESVVVNKAVTIVSENGPANCNVQAPTENDWVFHVTAEDVIISGFTVKGGSDNIRLDDSAHYCVIENNVILDSHDHGILFATKYNTIRNNWVSGSMSNGIQVHSNAMYNIVEYNNVTMSNETGILIWEASNNTIRNNKVWENGGNGIQLHQKSYFNLVENNNITMNNGNGIVIEAAENNTIRNNIIWDNSNNGVEVKGGSTGNVITRNTALTVDGNGIYVEQSSSNNQIYLNNFKDLSCDTTTNNTWNSPTQLTYYYAGQEYKNYLGNYWADYAGVDADENGIGDTPVSKNQESDNYPLMEMAEILLRPAGPPPNAVSASTSNVMRMSLVLNWTESDHKTFDRYEVFQSTTQGQLGTLIANITNIATTSLTVSNLSPDITYYFIVRVVARDGQFTDSAQVQAATAALPVAVSASASDVAETSLKLTWAQSSDPFFARYEVFQSATQGQLGTSIGNVTNIATTSLTVTGLSPGTTYYFTVRVVDGEGLPADSSQLSVTTAVPLWQQPWFIQGAVAGVVIVVATVAVILMKRKTK